MTKCFERPTALPNIDIQVEPWPIEKLIPCDNNPRTHGGEQVAQIAASIEEFGGTNAALVEPDGTVLAGHPGLEAAKKLRTAEVPVIILGHLTPAQRRALVTADNHLAIAGSGRNEEMLHIELALLQEAAYHLR